MPGPSFSLISAHKIKAELLNAVVRVCLTDVCVEVEALGLMTIVEKQLCLVEIFANVGDCFSGNCGFVVCLRRHPKQTEKTGMFFFFFF